jgi:RNA polymerase sigma-70 factor (ECF subfamily)
MSAHFKEYSDQQLYALLLEGGSSSRPAFDEIYQRYSPRIFTYCRRILGDGGMAEDMFQETFVRLFEGAKGKQDMTNLPAYLLRIARNLCLTEKKKQQRKTVTFEEFRFATHDSTYESTELVRLIETALETLKEEYRETYVLKEFLGMSYNEIAEITGVTMPVVRIRIYRAKTQIREILAPYIEDLQK